MCLQCLHINIIPFKYYHLDNRKIIYFLSYKVRIDKMILLYRGQVKLGYQIGIVVRYFFKNSIRELNNKNSNNDKYILVTTDRK